MSNLWDNEDPESAWWRLAHDPAALLADAKRQHAAKLYAEQRCEQLARNRELSKSVYVLFNDCPTDWDTLSIKGIYASKKSAELACVLAVGHDPFSMQYLVVQRWRVKL